MNTSSRLAALTLAACFTVALLAAPAGAAKQEISPRVTVQGAELPSVDPETLGTPNDPAIGRTVPTLIGEGFNGQAVTFEQGASPRIVIFLSHSCPHCQREVPLLVKLAKKGKLDGVEIQTVTTNTNQDFANYPPSKWLKREHWPFKPVLADDDKLRAFFGLGGAAFPYFVLADAEGNVVARVSGELSAKTITRAVKDLAAGESVFHQA